VAQSAVNGVTPVTQVTQVRPVTTEVRAVTERGAVRRFGAGRYGGSTFSSATAIRPFGGSGVHSLTPVRVVHPAQTASPVATDSGVRGAMRVGFLRLRAHLRMIGRSTRLYSSHAAARFASSRVIHRPMAGMVS